MNTWRQQAIVDDAKLASLHVTLIGAGGIGSPTALCLAKMGVQDLTVYDPDTVEDHNIPSQLYRLADIGKPKVDSLWEVVAAFANIALTPMGERFESQPSFHLSGLVISAVDSMATRQEIWRRVASSPDVEYYIEARMGSETGIVYALNPWEHEAVRAYEETLYEDSEALQLPCTARAIIYNVFGIAALIANAVKRLAMGQEIPFEVILDYATMSMMTKEVPNGQEP